MTPHMYSFPLWQQLETEKSSVGEISAFTMLSIAINNEININRYLYLFYTYVFILYFYMCTQRIAKRIIHTSKVTSAYVFNWLWRKFETKICYTFAYEYVSRIGKIFPILFMKVKTFWEGHKIWKNFPHVLTKRLFLLSSVKTSGRFFQLCVAFSEKLDFEYYSVFSCL